MKKAIKLFCLAAIALGMSMAFTSCGKEKEKPIVGTWEEVVHINYNDGSVRDVTETYVFNSDGTMTLQFACYDVYSNGSTWHMGLRWSGTYTDDGSKFSFKGWLSGSLDSEATEFTYFEPDMSGEPYMEHTYEYSISGNTMTVQYGGDSPIGHSSREVATLTRK